MKEYLIDSGGFNIIVVPERKQYFILDGFDAQGLERRFVDGERIDYDALPQRWFKYTDEAWTGFDGAEKSMAEVPEAALIEYFVLKKHNFGALVAVRDMTTQKVQVFKRERVGSAA